MGAVKRARGSTSPRGEMEAVKKGISDFSAGENLFPPWKITIGRKLSWDIEIDQTMLVFNYHILTVLP